MIKVIATFFICRVFSKIMIEELDVVERTDLPTYCCSLTNKAVFYHICMGIFFIHSMYGTVFVTKPSAAHSLRRIGLSNGH
jgi:hypothetical protein